MCTCKNSSIYDIMYYHGITWHHMTSSWHHMTYLFDLKVNAEVKGQMDDGFQDEHHLLVELGEGLHF